MNQDQTKDEIREAPYRQCVGCGYCCTKTPCTAARRIYGNGITACPALEWNDTRYTCKLMSLPGDMGHQYKRELYEGQGCCSPLNSWRTDVRLREKTPQQHTIFTKEFQAFLMAAGAEWSMSHDKLFLLSMHFCKLLIDAGYTEEQAKALAKQALHYMKSNKHGWAADFIG